jgi:hypothetical protein
MGLPSLADLVPFVDVGWKLLTRTLFKMAAFASISSVATTLPESAVASHQVRVGYLVIRSLFKMAAFASISSDCGDAAHERGRVAPGACLICFHFVRQQPRISVPPHGGVRPAVPANVRCVKVFAAAV